VRAVQAWLEAASITEGPVFRGVNRHGDVQPGRLSGYAVALVVKRYAAAAGLDPARYAGHSLRAGLATAAAIGGTSERSIMRQTGHKSVAMVRRYIRDGNLFRELRRSRELTHPCSYRVSQGVREIWNGGHHPRREACWCCFVACGEGAVSSTPKACGYRLLER
jgi:hypothetical protein